MKKIYKIFMLLVCTSLLFTGCDLDEYNPSAGDSSLTSYAAWSGLQTYCYSCLSDELYTSCDWMYASEGGTDLWLPKSNGTSYKQLFSYEDATPSYNTFNKVFKQCYSMITNCNTVINEAENVTDPNDDNMPILIAETKALRALYYSILVSHFGPVSLVLESNTSVTGIVDRKPVRATEKALYDQMIKDLTEAIEDLPVEAFDGNYARVTKKFAKGLLARVYAQRAGLVKYNDSQTYWKLAAETAEELISNADQYGAYLYGDVADMWADANNRNNKEALLIAAGCDANTASWQYATKNNKLSAYSTGGSYSEFWNSNHKPGDKGYFYGRLNSQNWMPSKYLYYCFNPKWDKRWEYSFQTAWNEWSMEQCGWVDYTAGTKKIDSTICAKYDITIDPTVHPDSTIYPYADCDGIASTYGGNQFPAKIWPKGDHSGNKSKLLSVASSAEEAKKEGFCGSTKAYAIPYPIDLDDDRFNTVFVHEPLEDKSKCIYTVVVLRDLYGSNDYPYGGVAQGSEAANPPLIGNGKTSASVYPGLIKFNWSYNGVFYSSNLQVKNGDMFIMRMAEVYLLAAEAEQQLGNGAKAADYLNVLRQRAAREGASEEEWKLSSATEDDIFDEYARELCGEFTRWALLKRHNAFETRLAKYNGRAAKSFKSFHYNRPISNDFLTTILNAEEYGDNGYGSTAKSGLDGLE